MSDRRPVAADHPLRRAEHQVSEAIVGQLDAFRDTRDELLRNWACWFYGPHAVGALLPPDPADEVVAQARAEADIARARTDAMQGIDQGGFAAAVCRIVLAGMVSIGTFERRSLHLARLLAQYRRTESRPESRLALSGKEWSTILRDQARITALLPVESLNALGQMLTDTDSREQALALAAAILMIEPTLANPRSEIIEYLIGTLAVDPMRVIDLARKMTDTLASTQPGLAIAEASASPRVISTRGAISAAKRRKGGAESAGAVGPIQS